MKGPRARRLPRSRMTRIRWVICALLFLATSINYVDRQVLGILAPTLEAEIGWSETDYGLIVTSFQAAYAIGLTGVGKVIDLVGTRIGYALAVFAWSLAAMGHGWARSVTGFALARFTLGLGEAGNFPAAVKTVTEWFPVRERALANGIFNSGSNVGAVIAPLLVPWLTVVYGWRWAFVVTGALGFIWLGLWWALYKEPRAHPWVNQSELDHISGDDKAQAACTVSWKSLLAFRETWLLALAKFITDPVWWFYLFWIPKFLHSQHELTLDRLGLPLVLIYLAADVGSIGGGWISSWLIKRGWPVFRARKTALLLCAVSAAPIVLVSNVTSLSGAVVLLSLATAAHQGWSTNLFTLMSDSVPRQATASLVGICGMTGAIGGMMASTGTGLILEWTGSYLPPFIMGGSAYLVAWVVLNFGMREQPTQFTQRAVADSAPAGPGD
ncbi:MAG: MFS transporter [Acidobacteriota bacterium]